MEGSYFAFKGNNLHQLYLIPLFSPFVAYVPPRGIFHILLRLRWDIAMFPTCLTSREGIDIKIVLPARNNSRRGRYPSLAFDGTSVRSVLYWERGRVM